MSIGKHCPRYTEYQALYKDSDGLQRSLCNFYASLIRYCTEAVRALRSQGTWSILTLSVFGLTQNIRAPAIHSDTSATV